MRGCNRLISGSIYRIFCRWCLKTCNIQTLGVSIPDWGGHSVRSRCLAGDCGIPSPPNKGGETFKLKSLGNVSVVSSHLHCLSNFPTESRVK